ncbi:MAG TPA: MMPL family transporter [Myxococcota bacterium]
MTRTGRFALLATGLALLVYCALNLRLGTDLTNFMPKGSRSEIARISSQLTDSPFTRTMVLSVEGPDTDAAIAAASQLAGFLHGHPEVAWVRSALDEADLEEIYALYFPRRHYFLSDDPEREIPALLSPAALSERARALRRRLASPASSFVDQLVASDPIGAFERIALRFRSDEPALRMLNGQFVTPDGRYAIVLAGTRASAFDSGAQTRLIDDLYAAFAELRAGAGGALHLEMSGANRFAVAAERSMKRDVYLIGACSFCGVALLFLIFVGSLRGFLVVSVPPLGGMLIATALGVALFGNLDGLTMVFGASLMGIAIDYSNHLLIHHGLARTAESPRETAQRLRPSITLGALTTIASFAGLVLTSFPAFREMSFFAGAGVAAALVLSLRVLPDLLHGVPALPARSRASAARLGALLGSLAGLPRIVLVLPAAVAALGLFALPRLQWSDDMSQLTRFDPDFVAEDLRVRERVSSFEETRFVLGLADDAASAVALNDRIHARLAGAIEAGALDGTRSLHRLLWSGELQRRSQRLVAADPTLYTRVEAAFRDAGFRPGALRPFGEFLAEVPPPPLALEDLQNSPLADLLAPFVFPLGDQIAVVTYLRNLRSPGAVREALADVEGAHLLDQRSFVNDIYREFRETTLEQMLVGGALVLLLLALRYRAWRPVLAAFLPSVLVAVLVLTVLALAGVRANLLHVMSLIMVMGMGVDYGVFLVDSAEDREAFGATMLSLLMSCLTTAFVFGTLAFSSQPALQSIGLTTGVGIVLSYLLAPVALAVLGIGRHAGGSGA